MYTEPARCFTGILAKAQGGLAAFSLYAKIPSQMTVTDLQEEVRWRFQEDSSLGFPPLHLIQNLPFTLTGSRNHDRS